MPHVALVPVLLLLVGCEGSSGGALPPPPAAASSERPAPAVPLPTPAPSAAPDPALQAQVADLELEVAQLKLVIEEMKQAGIGSVDAVHVSYQPNQTTLAARDVQAALDELWATVHSAQEAAVDMGEPGDGLFDLQQGPLGPRHSPSDQRPRPPEGQGPRPPEGQGPRPPDGQAR